MYKPPDVFLQWENIELRDCNRYYARLLFGLILDHCTFLPQRYLCDTLKGPSKQSESNVSCLVAFSYELGQHEMNHVDIIAFSIKNGEISFTKLSGLHHWISLLVVEHFSIDKSFQIILTRDLSTSKSEQWPRLLWFDWPSQSFWQFWRAQWRVLTYNF